MTPEYIGSFDHYEKAENFRRTWHVWVVCDEQGEVVCIHMGISQSLIHASGEIGRTNCDTSAKRKAFTFAEERTQQATWDEGSFAVIDHNDPGLLQ